MGKLSGADRQPLGLLDQVNQPDEPSTWPSLHWNLFDYYLHPAGSYFGAKIGARQQHVAYDYINKEVWLINYSINETGSRCVVCLCSFVSGLCDSITFNATNVFGSMQTGNTIFLARRIWWRRRCSSSSASSLAHHVHIATDPSVVDPAQPLLLPTPVTLFLVILANLESASEPVILVDLGVDELVSKSTTRYYDFTRRLYTCRVVSRD